MTGSLTSGRIAFPVRLALVALVALLAVLTGETTAFAQSAACRQLTRTLDMLNRNAAFRGLDSRTQDARRIAAQVQQDSSTYVRSGCQAIQSSGRRLPAQCQTLARRILAGQRDYADLSQNIETGNAVAQQREQVLQQIAQFGCNVRTARSGVDQPRRPGNIFEQLFGPFVRGGEGDFIEDQSGYGFNGDLGTIRTMCVRLSDGYYFPISYATLPDYIPQDADACQAACPGAAVELFYYNNPGQEPEDMINREGEPYASLPNAFAYRKAVDPNATCKVQSAATQGDITMLASPEGQMRPMANVEGREFPLPLLDPRRQQQASAPVQLASRQIDVPMPRPRPGDAPAETAPGPVKPPIATADERVVEIAGKKVRIVGPDTPYGRPVGAEP